MRHYLLLSVAVLLVLTHQQGGCWLESAEVPFSAVRHLSASRNLKGADIAPEDVPDKADIRARTFRPLFSWDLTTVTPISTSTFSDYQRKSIDGSAVSNTEGKNQRGKKLRNNKKKKENFIKGEDQSPPWHYSNANISVPAVLASWSSDNNNIPDTGLTRKERRKYRSKMKKERDKTPHVGQQEEVTKRKKKEKKLKAEKIKKEKRKKERNKHREETVRKGQNKKEKEQRSNNFLPDVSNITSKNNSKTRPKQDIIPKMSSSGENTIDVISGKYKEGANGNQPDLEKNKDNNLEGVNNEINGAELSEKLDPIVYAPQKNELLSADMRVTMKDNKIPSVISLFQAKDNTVLPRRTSSEYDKQYEANILKEERKSEGESVLTDMSSLARKESVTTTTTNVGRQQQNYTKQNHNLSNTMEIGDLSCLGGTFLPAPHVANAIIKYTRGKYLEAEYECRPDYKLEPVGAPRLVCSKHQWLGESPKCLPHKERHTNKLTGALHNVNTSASDLGCRDRRGGCDQLCTVVGNQPICSCFRGFRLKGTTCHDVDECSYSNGGCEVSCHNKPGSYQCSCPPGFRLSANGKNCLDINECLLRNGHGPCQGSCHNLPGSYTCNCEGIIGTRLAANNHTCEDVDECARNNAGCSHTCLNTLGRAFCLCPPGFMLGTDWKTCHDIDECADPELQGEHCSVGCVNTLGSYQCVDLRDQPPSDHPSTSTEPTTSASSMPVECLPGFEVGPFGSCMDIDECVIDNGGCSHVCQNTLGGAHCRCPPGFLLQNDWKSCKAMEVQHIKQPKIPIICAPGYIRTREGHCKDIDECAIQNGGCMQGCVNIRGSYCCICGRGFFLGADRKTCIEERMDIVCPPLPTPTYGYLECTRRAIMVAPERWRARWRRRIVNHAGAVCELKCPHGYKVHGEYRKVCESNGNWAGPQDGYCTSFPKPNIECPQNISVEIELAKATAFVTFPQPTTDVDWLRNVMSKPSWGKLLESDLPPGHWPVTFTARHPISRHTASCTLGITVTTSTISTEVPKDIA